MPSFKDLFRLPKLQTASYPLLKEFQGYMEKVHEVSVSDFGVEEKRKKYGEFLDELSEGAYVTYFMQILNMVQTSKDDCQKFKNSEKQVDNILSWLPRMKGNRELVLLAIQERRKKYKLQI